MGVSRKLEDVRRGLTVPSEQGKLIGFLANADNAQKINGLVEDLREALMDYQVHIPNYSFSATSNSYIRLHCSRISMIRAADSL